MSHSGVASRLEQHIGAVDVGGDELARRLDRAVDVGLGGEVDDRIATLHGGPDGLAIRDVGLDQLEALVGKPFEVLAAPGVGELVEGPDGVIRV
jgi:hypothetical protein